MAELESVPEIEVVQDNKVEDQKRVDEERAKKTVEELKAANEEYQKLDRELREKRAEVERLQVAAYAALQRATSMNEQFNMSVNSQLLQERNKLQNEVNKLQELLNKNLKIQKK